MNTLFLDFAETLGYRNSPEIESDLTIISKYLKLHSNEIGNKYEDYLKTSNFYDRSLSFPSFSAELEFTVSHFQDFLSKQINIQNSISLAEDIAKEKYQTLVHSLYSEVYGALREYKQKYVIYILSDGRPSRRKTLDQLELKDFCEEYFISDEVGFLKRNDEFYKAISTKICLTGDVYFVDDQEINLDAFSKVLKAKCILMDRKHSLKRDETKYITIDKLPSPLT